MQYFVAGEGTVPLAVPTQASGQLVLETGVECDRDNCLVKSAFPLRLVGPVRDVIIRPWSRYYKPGETEFFLPRQPPGNVEWQVLPAFLMHSPGSVSSVLGE
ncbi:unnamed protein product [Nezara viridula]|uniref:Uncharacterized protein n=1 Tax=Nezara viridula TaxID=85310 RepID=A0A9P0MM34_NEZVI|nr:unnamed protein product [Nezara viridula]